MERKKNPKEAIYKIQMLKNKNSVLQSTETNRILKNMKSQMMSNEQAQQGQMQVLQAQRENIITEYQLKNGVRKTESDKDKEDITNYRHFEKRY